MTILAQNSFDSLSLPPSPSPTPKRSVGGGDSLPFFQFRSPHPAPGYFVPFDWTFKSRHSAGFGITRLSLNPDAPAVCAGVDWLGVGADYFPDRESMNLAIANILGTEDFRWDESQGFALATNAKRYSVSFTCSKFPSIRGGYNYIEISADNDPNGVASSYYEVYLIFPGEFFAGLTLKQQYRHLRKCRYNGFYRCGRIDTCIDDNRFSDLIPYAQIEQAFLDGNVFGAKKLPPAWEEYDAGQLVGWGLYFGSRQSDRYTRIYLHTNHDGSHCLRYECEHRGGYAQPVFELLTDFRDGYLIPSPADQQEEDCLLWYDGEITSPEIKLLTDKIITLAVVLQAKPSNHDLRQALINLISQRNILINYFAKFDRSLDTNFDLSDDGLENFSRLLMGATLGHFDCRDKSTFSDKANPSRQHCDRLPFWQEFLDKLGGCVEVKRSAAAVVPSLPRSIRWIFRQCSNLISVLFNGLGDKFDDFIELMAEYGNLKLQGKHFDMMDLLIDNPQFALNFALDCVGDQLEF